MNENENDLIPVWIVLNNENEAEIKSKIEDVIKVDIENYTDSKMFYNNIVPELQEKVISEYGRAAAFEPVDIEISNSIDNFC